MSDKGPVDPSESYNGYKEAYLQYSDDLIILVYKKSGDKDIAKDIVQTVFLRFMIKNKLSGFTGSLFKYLAVACINEYRQRYRTFRRRQDAEQINAEYAPTIEEDHFSEDFDIRNKINDAISRLPAEWRNVIILKFKYNLPDHITAKLLDISVDRVRNVRKYVIKYLRKDLIHLR